MNRFSIEDEAARREWAKQKEADYGSYVLRSNDQHTGYRPVRIEAETHHEYSVQERPVSIHTIC